MCTAIWNLTQLAWMCSSPITEEGCMYYYYVLTAKSDVAMIQYLFSCCIYILLSPGALPVALSYSGPWTVVLKINQN